jgi:hypothetical protein
VATTDEDSTASRLPLSSRVSGQLS